jgi:hypothetical protein
MSEVPPNIPLPPGFSAPTKVIGDEPVGVGTGALAWGCISVLGAAIAAAAVWIFDWSGLCCFGGAAVFTVFAALAMLWVGLTQQRVLICPEGFVHITNWSTRGCLWDDVADVRQRLTDYKLYGVIQTSSDAKVTVRCRDGRHFTFNSTFLNGADDVGRHIDEEVCRRRLPEVMADIRAGDEVDFGPLSVSARGLSSASGSVTWDEVQSVEISQGVVMVNQHGKWFSWSKVAAGDIPNLLLFLTVVDQLHGLKRP